MSNKCSDYVDWTDAMELGIPEKKIWSMMADGILNVFIHEWVGIFDYEYGRYENEPEFDQEKTYYNKIDFLRIKPDAIRKSMIVNSRHKTETADQNLNHSDDVHLYLQEDLWLDHIPEELRQFGECGHRVLCEDKPYFTRPASSGFWFLKVDLQNIISQNFEAPIAKKETPEQRRTRISKQAEELKAKGCTNHIKTIAAQENLSESRVKQLLAKSKKSYPSKRRDLPS